MWLLVCICSKRLTNSSPYNIENVPEVIKAWEVLVTVANCHAEGQALVRGLWYLARFRSFCDLVMAECLTKGQST